MYDYVSSQEVLAAATGNGSNWYILADIFECPNSSGGGKGHNEANAAVEFPQFFNFAGSILHAIVISVSIKTVWIRDHNTKWDQSSRNTNTPTGIVPTN
jgi:hypothetical protein